MDPDPRKRGPAAPASFEFVLKQFFLPAVLLIGVMFPLYLMIEYKSGGLRDVLFLLGGWAVLACVYWLPIGMLLFRWKGHWLGRLAAGYLLSLPLYFAALALVYPAFGFRFRPRSPSAWGIYFSATPTYFLLVLALYLLVRRGQTLAHIVQTAAAAIFLAAVIASLVVWARVDPYKWSRQATPRVDIVNGKIVDAADNRIVEGQNIQIENGRILKIVPAAEDQSGFPKIDAHGSYLIPGLIDVHAHLQTPMRSILGAFSFTYFLDSLLGDYAPQRREYLETGVTAVRDDGGPAAHIFALRSKLARHQLLGPRLFAVGRLVTSPHGHPVSTIWTPAISRQGAILASDSASLLAGLEKNYREGPPDAVKIIYGTIDIAKEKISRSLLDQAVAWANARHLISVVHIGTTQEATDAVQAGATGIEHFATIESLPDSLIADVVAHHTFIDPTFGELRSARTLASHKKYDIDRELQQKDELAEFAKAGFTPAQILVFATRNNAAYLGKPKQLGSIAPGYAADIVLARENPLDDLRALRKPLWVMLDGEIVVGHAALAP